MRLFVALDLSDDVRAAAAECIERLRRRLARASPSATLGWVPPERLHLTIQFIGEVPPPVVEEVGNRLSPPYPLAPFELSLSGTGMFPPSGRPRVVWVGIDAGAAEVRQVHVETVSRLEGVQFRREARPFAPHLTLGRFREPGFAAHRHAAEGMKRQHLGRCTIAFVTLYQSRLSPKGPTYVPLQRVPLVAGR